MRRWCLWHALQRRSSDKYLNRTLIFISIYLKDDEYDESEEDETEENFVTETESTTTETPETTTESIPIVTPIAAAATASANDDKDYESILPLDAFASTLATNSEIDDGRETTTELPYIVDVGVRNENEIVKFSPPISTSIIDDSNSDIESSSYASYIVPLKIILPVEHVHKTKHDNGSFERFNYILLKVDDASYHEHIYSDNSDFLLPVERNTKSPTTKSVSGNSATETATNTSNMINADRHEIISDPIQRDNNNANGREDSDTVLVDSQGYRYALSKHYNIMDEQGASAVEFDEIAMVRDWTQTKSNHSSKRILIDHTPKPTTVEPTQKSNVHNELYEGHYAKIFQWLHYHL